MVRALKAALWTLGLALGIWLVDRVVLSRTQEKLWNKKLLTQDIPKAFLPAYLPDTLSWPPVEIWVHQDRQSVWIGMSNAQNEMQLWIGSIREAEGLPKNLAYVASCAVGAQRLCPSGWVRLRRDPYVVLSRLEPLQNERIIAGLGADHGADHGL